MSVQENVCILKSIIQVLTLMQNTRSQIFSVFSQLVLPCLAAAIWMILIAVSFSLAYSLDDFPVPPWILFYMSIILPPLVIILLVERRKHQRSTRDKKTDEKLFLVHWRSLFVGAICS